MAAVVVVAVAKQAGYFHLVVLPLVLDGFGEPMKFADSYWMNWQMVPVDNWPEVGYHVGFVGPYFHQRHTCPLPLVGRLPHMRPPQPLPLLPLLRLSSAAHHSSLQRLPKSD